jgi:hypothetical protein
LLKKVFVFLMFIFCALMPAISVQAEEMVNVTAIPRSDPASSTSNEQRGFHHSSFEVTGLFLPQGEEIIVEVEEAPENAQLMIGQWGEYNGVENITNGKLNFGGGSFKLVKGENRFSNTKTGGMVYINNLSDTQTLHVKVTGGRKVPLYIQGTTDINEFKTALTNAQDVPFMELANDKVIVTTRIDRTKDIFLKGNQADDFLTYAKEIVDLENQAADLSVEGSYSSKKAPQRLHIANPTTGAGNLYCTNYFLGIHSRTTSDLTVFKSKSGQSSWGLFHEIGHSYQNPYYTWNNMGEVTVNIYSNYVSGHMSGINSPYDAVESKTKNNAYRSVIKRYFDNKAKDSTWSIEKETAAYSSNYHFGVLGMYVGLERAFGDNFYPMLNRLYRTTPSQQLPTNNLEKQQYFVIQTSKLTKTDLTPYFDFWGVPITEETRKELDSLGYPILKKEIWKDLLATEAEEKAGTYRISKKIQSVESFPRATPRIDITELKVQELNRLDAKDYFTDLHSEPTPSKVTSVVFEEKGFWQLSAQTSKVFLKNELGVSERAFFKLKVVPQDTYVMSGQRGVYMILDYDKVNQELVAKGRNVKILENLPNNVYPVVTIYDENYTMKKEVTGKGSTYGNQLARQLDKEKLAVGDIVKIYHKEAQKRSMRYVNGSRVTTSQDTYYYKITENGWLPIEPKPTGNGVERTIRIGEEVTAEDMVTNVDPVIGKQLKIAWSKLPVYAGNFGKDDLVNTQEVSVKLTNGIGENTWIFTDLTIKRGNSLKITGESHKEKVSMVVNEKHQLKAYGANSSFHNGTYKEKNYNQIQIFTKEGTLKKAVTSFGKDTGASAAEQLHNLQLEVGDYIRVISAEGDSHFFAYEQDQVAPKKSTSGDLITYQVTNDGWEQVVVQPNITSQNQTFQIGQTPTAEDFVSASDYLFGNELLSFKWGTNQPKTLSKGVSLSDYLQQQVTVEPLVSKTPMSQVSASLSYRLNNTINVVRHGGYGTFITYDPSIQKLTAQGTDPYTLNGTNKDTKTPLLTLEVIYQASDKQSFVLQAFNNTKASELTSRINNANLQLEVGDIVKITHARQNQEGLSLDADTKKYVTKAMTAFIDDQKIDQFSGTSQYYLITPTGLELHQNALD